MKKILSLTLALLMILACTPIVMAESEFEYVDYEGGIAITGYNGDGGVVTIPAEINGKKVVATKGTVSSDVINALGGRNDITKIIVSEGIEIIDSNSFCKMTNLKEVILPSTLKKIGYEAFAFSGITAINIPESVTSIGNGAFNGSQLKSLHIPKNAKLSGSIIAYSTTIKKITVDSAHPTYAADGKFLYSKASGTAVDYAGGITDKRITIPNYILNIMHYCFMENQHIETVITHKNLVKIYYWTFNGCSNLKEVYVTGKNTLVSNSITDNPNLIVYTNGKICDFADGERDTCDDFIVKPYVDGMENITFEYQVMSDGTIMLDKYTGTETNVTIPETYRGYKVTWINNEAFASNKKIKSVHIPKSITFIGQAVFADCDSLTKITTDNSIYASTGTILYRKDNNRIIGYACGAKTSELKIPSNIKTIAPSSFQGADNLKAVITNKGLQEIGYSAFKDCKNLKSVYVVDDNTFVDGYLFDGVTDKTVIYYNGNIEMQAGKVPCKILPYTAGMENAIKVEKTTDKADDKNSTTPNEDKTQPVEDPTTSETVSSIENTTAKTDEQVNATVSQTENKTDDTTENKDNKDKNNATPIIIAVSVVAVGAVAVGVTFALKKKKK